MSRSSGFIPHAMVLSDGDTDCVYKSQLKKENFTMKPTILNTIIFGRGHGFWVYGSVMQSLLSMLVALNLVSYTIKTN